MLTRKHFEYPEKGTSASVIELDHSEFRLLRPNFKSPISGWGRAVNNSCTVYEHLNDPKIIIEEHSFNNLGFAARYYLVEV